MKSQNFWQVMDRWGQSQFVASGIVMSRFPEWHMENGSFGALPHGRKMVHTLASVSPCGLTI